MRLHPQLELFRPDTERPLVLGLGNFDGVHLGHQALIKRVVAYARKIRGVPALFTFPEHPQKTLQPDFKPDLLSSLDQRLFLFEPMEITDVFLIPFTASFSEIRAEDFVQKILCEKLNVKAVFMGQNARFGHKRAGNIDLMEALSLKMGFHFEKIEPVLIKGKEVSSSRIRELLLKGKMEEANQCLGHHYSVFGSVMHGSGRGHDLGFPTANLDAGDCLLPPEGVYPVHVRQIEIHRRKMTSYEEFSAKADSLWKQGVLNYGTRPTFEQSKVPIAEVFILNWQGDLYGKCLECMFYPRIRKEQSFAGKDDLVNQIQKDIGQAKAFFTKI